MLSLRPYQTECLEGIKARHAKGQFRQLVTLPTGSGKTVIFSYLVKDLNGSALILAHTNELLEQAREKIEMICSGLKVGIVNGEYKEFDERIVVASIQSARQPQNLSRLIDRDFDLVIADEAHHFAAESHRKV